MRPKRASQKQIRERVEEIASLKLLGAQPSDIRKHIQEAGWNVSKRQLQRYSNSANELIAENVEANRDKLMAFHYGARRALYARCMSVSDYATALRCLQDESQLLGLYPTKKVEVTGNGTPLVLHITEVIIAKPATAAIKGGEIINVIPDNSKTPAGSIPGDSPSPIAGRLPAV